MLSKMARLINLIGILTLTLLIVNGQVFEEICGKGWVPFGEEKCYRLVTEQIATWQKAKEICDSLGDGEVNGTLVIIKSTEEEDFIEDNLFNQKHVLEKVWIGAKRSDANSDFRWVDGSKLDYQHWEEGEPLNDNDKNCVQLLANDHLLGSEGAGKRDGTNHIGRWSNTQCKRHNFNVLCEKTQKITFAKLTAIVFELKKKYEKEKKDAIAEMQTVEGDLKHRIEELEKNETSYQMQIDALSKSEESLKEKVSTLACSLKNTSAVIDTLEINLRHEIDVLKKNESFCLIKIAELGKNVTEIEVENTKFNKELKNVKKEENDLKVKIGKLEKNETALANTIKINEDTFRNEMKQLKDSEQIFEKSINERMDNIVIKGSAAVKNTIYVQYPFELEPFQVLNCSRGRWKDISSTYDSLFFRVAGSKSSSWTAIQEDNSPCLYEILKWSCGGEGSDCPNMKVYDMSGGSSGVIQVSHSVDHELAFHVKGGEVRPRNMAIKLWKCVVP